jgi:hypothetical protein
MQGSGDAACLLCMLGAVRVAYMHDTGAQISQECVLPITLCFEGHMALCSATCGAHGGLMAGFVLVCLQSA